MERQADSPIKSRSEHARSIFQAAVRACQPDLLIRGFDFNAVTVRALEAYRHVRVLGVGKGALAMAGAIEKRLGDRITDGFVVTANGYSETLPGHLSRPRRIEVSEGGHPVPNAGSKEAAQRILKLAAQAEQTDLVIVLITGGGSSVCTDFLGDIGLDDARETFRLLLRAGVDVYAFNAVRKHMSTVGGGRLAAALYPAEVLTLAISDVVGDDLSVIASGPTTGDPSTFADAVDILKNAGIWDDVPDSVLIHFQRGLADGSNETHKPGDRCFGAVTQHILATNNTALGAAAAEAERLGYRAVILERGLTGEAREAGRRLAQQVLSSQSREGWCFLAGGETSVTVQGEGKGGRNQEMALAAALALAENPSNIVYMSCGTDGIDGPTDAAGAIASSRTVGDARSRGLDPQEHLDNNDSYRFFDAVDGLVRTGPTHTNVMDVQIILT